MKGPFSTFISLGPTCCTKYQIGRHVYFLENPHATEEEYRGVVWSDQPKPLGTYVFDWQITHTAPLLHYFENKFLGLFELDDLEPTEDGSDVLNRRTGARHTHMLHRQPGELYTLDSIRSGYPGARAKFDYISQKLVDNLRSKNPTLYILNHFIEPAEVDEIIRFLSSNPDHPFHLLLVDCKVRLKNYDQPGDLLSTAFVPERSMRKPDAHQWEGDDEAWADILSSFQLTLGRADRMHDIEKERDVGNLDQDAGLPIMRPRRIVTFDPGCHPSYEELQSAYLDKKNMMFYKSVDVNAFGTLFFRTNEFGGKGAQLDATRPTIGFFGDSVTQGAGPTDSWVNYVDVGYQVFNGGIEGSPLQSTIERALNASRKMNFSMVAIHPGWHNLIYGELSDEFWTEQFDRLSDVSNIAIFTLDSDFHPAILKDTPRYVQLEEGDINDPEYYLDWRGYSQVKNGLNQFRTQVDKKNDLLRWYCESRGRHLIDLSAVRPTSREDVGRLFFDLIHFRPAAYQRVGTIVSEKILPFLDK